MRNTDQKLRTGLMFNALFSAASGLLLLFTGGAIAQWMGAGAPWVYRIVGAGLLVFALTIWSTLRAASLNLKKVKMITWQDLGWVLGSILVLVTNPFEFTPSGQWTVGSVAFIVLIFATWQTVGAQQLNSDNGKHDLLTEILIDAPTDSVWQVLTKFEDYDEWNPFVNVEGRLVVGQQLTATFKFGNEQVFKPHVQSVTANQEFSWLGKLWVKGLFDGEHYFRLVPLSNGQTRLIHGEHFNGLLVGLIMRMVKEDTVTGFNAMNKALKARVEAMMAPQPTTR